LLALPALLTATTLLAALASGLLLLLTGLLLAALLLAALLTALLLTALLLPALFHITHLVVRHGELSFAEGLRNKTIVLHLRWFRSEQMWLAAMPEPRSKPAVSPNYRRSKGKNPAWWP
jgi:hypothetical protein